MNAPLTQLQETLNHEIPLTLALGLRVESLNDGVLIVSSPLAPNINHKDTAFAGSLNAVVTLAGWSRVWLLLREQGLPGKIVIQDSNIRYLTPVTRDFTARCPLPAEADVERFLQMVRRRGRGRLELRVEIVEDDRIAVEFTGRYVVEGKG